MNKPIHFGRDVKPLSEFTHGGTPELPPPFDVTPEMIDVGWSVYENLNATYPPFFLVVEIYKAMAWERHLQDLRAKE